MKSEQLEILELYQTTDRSKEKHNISKILEGITIINLERLTWQRWQNKLTKPLGNPCSKYGRFVDHIQFHNQGFGKKTARKAKVMCGKLSSTYSMIKRRTDITDFFLQLPARHNLCGVRKLFDADSRYWWGLPDSPITKM